MEPVASESFSEFLGRARREISSRELYSALGLAVLGVSLAIALSCLAPLLVVLKLDGYLHWHWAVLLIPLYAWNIVAVCTPRRTEDGLVHSVETALKILKHLFVVTAEIVFVSLAEKPKELEGVSWYLLTLPVVAVLLINVGEALYRYMTSAERLIGSVFYVAFTVSTFLSAYKLNQAAELGGTDGETQENMSWWFVAAPIYIAYTVMVLLLCITPNSFVSFFFSDYFGLVFGPGLPVEASVSTATAHTLLAVVFTATTCLTITVSLAIASIANAHLSAAVVAAPLFATLPILGVLLFCIFLFLWYDVNQVAVSLEALHMAAALTEGSTPYPHTRLDKTVIESFPTHTYGSLITSKHADGVTIDGTHRAISLGTISVDRGITPRTAAGYGGSDVFTGDVSDCAICLTEFVVGDTLRTLPCGHIYHAQCIDGWLGEAVVCPLCKRDLRVLKGPSLTLQAPSLTASMLNDANASPASNATFGPVDTFTALAGFLDSLPLAVSVGLNAQRRVEQPRRVSRNAVTPRADSDTSPRSSTLTPLSAWTARSVGNPFMMYPDHNPSFGVIDEGRELNTRATRPTLSPLDTHPDSNTSRMRANSGGSTTNAPSLHSHLTSVAASTTTDGVSYAGGPTVYDIIDSEAARAQSLAQRAGWFGESAGKGVSLGGDPGSSASGGQWRRWSVGSNSGGNSLAGGYSTLGASPSTSVVPQPSIHASTYTSDTKPAERRPINPNYLSSDSDMGLGSGHSCGRKRRGSASSFLSSISSAAGKIVDGGSGGYNSLSGDGARESVLFPWKVQNGGYGGRVYGFSHVTLQDQEEVCVSTNTSSSDEGDLVRRSRGHDLVHSKNGVVMPRLSLPPSGSLDRMGVPLTEETVATYNRANAARANLHSGRGERKHSRSRSHSSRSSRSHSRTPPPVVPRSGTPRSRKSYGSDSTDGLDSLRHNVVAANTTTTATTNTNTTTTAATNPGSNNHKNKHAGKNARSVALLQEERVYVEEDGLGLVRVSAAGPLDRSPAHTNLAFNEPPLRAYPFSFSDESSVVLGQTITSFRSNNTDIASGFGDDSGMVSVCSSETSGDGSAREGRGHLYALATYLPRVRENMRESLQEESEES